MRAVLLTGSGLQHRYVADVLARELGADLLAVIVARRRPASARLRSLLRRYTTRQLLSLLASRLYRRLTGAKRARRATYTRFFHPEGEPRPSPAAGRLTEVPDHNGADCLALLDRLDPDVIAVYGTALIRRPVLQRAKRGALNLHTGVSPRYRGSDTIFWALHNGEPEWVGATVHLLDPGIDSGPILAVLRPRIESGDGEDSLFCKCVVLGARELAAQVRAVAAGTAAARAQRLEEGREYRSLERTVAAERRVRRLLRKGMLCRFAASS